MPSGSPKASLLQLGIWGPRQELGMRVAVSRPNQLCGWATPVGSHEQLACLFGVPMMSTNQMGVPVRLVCTQ